MFVEQDEVESAGVEEDQYQGSRGFGYVVRKDGSMLEEDQYHAVELNRGSRGFGFSIRGGKEFQNMPLYVLQIAENGPAAVNDKLKVGISKKKIMLKKIEKEILFEKKNF